jgi:hypothetical protein
MQFFSSLPFLQFTRTCALFKFSYFHISKFSHFTFSPGSASLHPGLFIFDPFRVRFKQVQPHGRKCKFTSAIFQLTPFLQFSGTSALSKFSYFHILQFSHFTFFPGSASLHPGLLTFDPFRLEFEQVQPHGRKCEFTYANSFHPLATQRDRPHFLTFSSSLFSHFHISQFSH